MSRCSVCGEPIVSENYGSVDGCGYGFQKVLDLMQLKIKIKIKIEEV